MKLADLRKFAIRKQVRIRFPLKNGMECVVNERGVAQVAALQAPPEFNLEEELSGAATFLMEPVTAVNARNAPKPSSIGRDQLAAMTAEGGSAAHAHDEHEEE
jgi:hypothetical protein